MKRLALILAFIITGLLTKAQIVNPTTWTFDSKQNGNEVELIFKAKIEKGWHLYDTDLPEGGPIATTFVYEDSAFFEFDGKIQKNPMPVIHYDETFQINVGYFSNEVVLTQKIKLLSDSFADIKGNVLFMSCNDENCTPPEEVEFSFQFNTENKVADKAVVDINTGSPDYGEDTMLWFLIMSAIAGFL